jgi:hypothetical protein
MSFARIALRCKNHLNCSIMFIINSNAVDLDKRPAPRFTFIPHKCSQNCVESLCVQYNLVPKFQLLDFLDYRDNGLETYRLSRKGKARLIVVFQWWLGPYTA